MKVIFLQNVKGTAQIGDVKKVSSGYARNHLIPRGMAKIADGDAMKHADILKQQRHLEREKRDTWAKEIAEKIGGVQLSFAMDANEEGGLYGSLDAKTIVGRANEHGLNLRPDDLKLNHPIKEIGEHSVPLHLPEEYKASLMVTVTKKSA